MTFLRVVASGPREPAAELGRSPQEGFGVDVTCTGHFWVGNFPKGKVADYFAEVYCVDREEAPVSAFARDQGEKWYDHDFLEYGGREGAGSIQELVAGYSWSNQWADELARRVAAAGLSGVDFFVFIDEGEIKRPRSVQGDGYWLHYLGTIEYHF